MLSPAKLEGMLRLRTFYLYITFVERKIKRAAEPPVPGLGMKNKIIDASEGVMGSDDLTF